MKVAASPSASASKAGLRASTSSRLPSRLTPAGSSETDSATTDSMSPLSTSDAPWSRSRRRTLLPSNVAKVSSERTVGASFVPVTVRVTVCGTLAPFWSTTSKLSVMTSDCPTPSASNAALSVSRTSVLPDRVTPAGRTASAKSTDSTAPSSTSEAPASRSTVTVPAPSAAVSVSAASTVGASLVPVIVNTAVAPTVAPNSSLTV